jgi:hypothetical protein
LDAGAAGESGVEGGALPGAIGWPTGGAPKFTLGALWAPAVAWNSCIGLEPE